MSLPAVDCVAPALQHARQQLFSPFRLGQWSRLALVAVLAGELHVGSCNFGNWGQFAQQRRRMGDEFLAPAFPNLDPARIAQFAGLIAAIVVLAVVLFFVFLYINSVFRFILFDSVLQKRCSIGDGWQRWHRPGRRYFLWQLVLVFSSLMFFGLLIGVPMAIVGVGIERTMLRRLYRSFNAGAEPFNLPTDIALTPSGGQMLPLGGLQRRFLIAVRRFRDLSLSCRLDSRMGSGSMATEHSSNGPNQCACIQMGLANSRR